MNVVLIWLGAVVASAAGGFTSEHTLTIDATPARVYGALTVEIAAWWDPAHSYYGDARNFSLAPVPGGCFCENAPNGGGVEHMRVAIVKPDEQIRLLGGLGPLQGMGASGTMDFVLSVADAGSRLDYRYVVTGHGVGALADAVDRVQLGQLERLKRYIETGDPRLRSSQ